MQISKHFALQERLIIHTLRVGPRHCKHREIAHGAMPEERICRQSLSDVYPQSQTLLMEQEIPLTDQSVSCSTPKILEEDVEQRHK